MKYGIVIIALGYPLYGNTAFNLALSIKDQSPDIPIALVYEPSALAQLTEIELGFFDRFIELPAEYYMVKGKPQYQRAKLCIDLITAKLKWDFVFYMDADNLWNQKPIEALFNKIKDRQFYIGYNGHYHAGTKQRTNINYTYWVRPGGSEKTICNYHKIEKFLPQTVSGFMFFKKGEKANQMFEKAREVYDDPGTPTMTWANGKPDEYCINIALALQDYTQEKAHIFYFDNINGTIKNELIEENFFGFATGGNKVSPKLVHLYNYKVNQLCIKHGIKSRHYHVDKKDVIAERKEF